MNDRDDPDKTTAGAAALSICESLLIALNDLEIIDDKEKRAVLRDAAELQRHAGISESRRASCDRRPH
jgi:hypothetical protein